MAMTGGYPEETDINSFLSIRGLELITEGEAPFHLSFKKYVWGLLNALDWATALGVYCPSPTTINVRSGKYLFKGTVKTFVAGSAINPTDNDTTYVWMTASNAIGSGIDGSGWPTTEHVKLAEVDVNSSGVITAIRDLRGQTFFEYRNDAEFFDKIVTHNGEVVCHDGNVISV